MTTVEQNDINDGMLSSVARHWGLVLSLGIVSIVVGIIALVWPAKTIVVLAFLLAIWLIITGVFSIIRGFSRGLSGGMRALIIITGVLSIILGLLAFRGIFQAVEILAIFVAIAFLFQGFGALFTSAERTEGRGWNIFAGIVMLIGGIVILVWPGISLVTLAWVAGIWLIVGGLFEVVAAFRIRSLAKAAA
jgi:uncharacterized membrane protein HdeD (DUF308 family)